MLTFPTMADIAFREFRLATKTVSLATIAKRMKADVERKWGETVYTFDDDTSLVVKGRGRAHRVEILMP